MSRRVAAKSVEAVKGEISITQACAWLGISRSTYYRWKTRSFLEQKDPTVEKIRQLCMQHKFRYGYRKVTALLRKKQMPCKPDPCILLFNCS
ncbi:IS3 family transposase [Brevibacillus sp. SYSU BS000544]|uniref:IS3 family transposase n=1 Tax=Brevibacillus sp. SYSU BS000544 TaxID=3416443 RepID=UPI003CE4DEE2